MNFWISGGLVYEGAPTRFLLDSEPRYGSCSRNGSCRLLIAVFAVALQFCRAGAAECKKSLRVALLPKDEAFVTVKLHLPPKPGKNRPPKKIVGDPSLNDSVLAGETTEPFFFGRCQVIPQGAPVQVKIVKAEKPSRKEGRGGFVEIQLVEVVLADGEARKIQGAATSFVRGATRTGKLAWVIERTGKKAFLRPDDHHALRLAAAPPDQQDKVELLPTVFYLCPEDCDVTAGGR